MKVRSLALALPLALAALAAPARADDAPKTYKIVMRTRWTAGAVVTLAATEHKVQNIVKVVEAKPVEAEGFGKSEESSTYEAIMKCVEATADGHASKSIIYFKAFEHKKDASVDTSLTGVHVEITGVEGSRTVKVVTPGKELSAETVAWLEQRFGNGAKGDKFLALLEPKESQAVGASWNVSGSDLVKAMDDGQVPLDATGTKAEVQLVGVEGDEVEFKVALDVALKGLPIGPGNVLAWKDGGKAVSKVKFARGLAAESLEFGVEKEEDFDGIADAKEFEVHMAIKGAESVRMAKGGDMPEVAKAK